MRSQLFIGVMSALYSVWDIVSLPIPMLLALANHILDSATTSLFERLTLQMPASLPSAMAVLPAAGVLSGPLSPSASWLSASLVVLQHSGSHSASKKTPRSILFPLSKRTFDVS